MCRYCQQKSDGSWRGQTRYGLEWYLDLHDKQKFLTVRTKAYDRICVPINYCPHCGERVKEYE